jgi:Trk-type K+ transport system membrane component
MNSKIWLDLLQVWIMAIVFGFIAFLAWGFSVHDESIEDYVGCAIPAVIILVGIIVTILIAVNIVAW